MERHFASSCALSDKVVRDFERDRICQKREHHVGTTTFTLDTQNTLDGYQTAPKERCSAGVIFVVIIAICQSRILNIYAHFPFDFRVMIVMFVHSQKSFSVFVESGAGEGKFDFSTGGDNVAAKED